jgi:hypothetical protein
MARHAPTITAGRSTDVLRQIALELVVFTLLKDGNLAQVPHAGIALAVQGNASCCLLKHTNHQSRIQTKRSLGAVQAELMLNLRLLVA